VGVFGANYPRRVASRQKRVKLTVSYGTSISIVYNSFQTSSDDRDGLLLVALIPLVLKTSFDRDCLLVQGPEREFGADAFPVALLELVENALAGVALHICDVERVGDGPVGMRRLGFDEWVINETVRFVGLRKHVVGFDFNSLEVHLLGHKVPENDGR